jgi:hypothetical protein
LDGFVRAICSLVKAVARAHAVGATLSVVVAVVHHLALFGCGAARCVSILDASKTSCGNKVIEKCISSIIIKVSSLRVYSL